MTGTSHSAPANNNAFRCPVDHLEARRLLDPEGPDQLIVTDSTLPTRLVPAAGQRAPVVLPASGLLAEAVGRMASGGSVVALRELEAAKD